MCSNCKLNCEHVLLVLRFDHKNLCCPRSFCVGVRVCLCAHVCVAGAEVWHPMCKEAIGMEKKLRVSMLSLSTELPSTFCRSALFISRPTGPMNQQPHGGFLMLSILGTVNWRLLSMKRISII